MAKDNAYIGNAQVLTQYVKGGYMKECGLVMRGVFLTLLAHRNPDLNGTIVWPSLKELARLTGSDVADITRALAALDKLGVTKLITKGGGTKSTRRSVWATDLPPLVDFTYGGKSTMPENHNGAIGNSPDSSCEIPPEVPGKSTTRTINQQSKEQNNQQSSEGDLDSFGPFDFDIEGDLKNPSGICYALHNLSHGGDSPDGGGASKASLRKVLSKPRGERLLRRVYTEYREIARDTKRLFAIDDMGRFFGDRFNHPEKIEIEGGLTAKRINRRSASNDSVLATRQERKRRPRRASTETQRQLNDEVNDDFEAEAAEEARLEKLARQAAQEDEYSNSSNEVTFDAHAD